MKNKILKSKIMKTRRNILFPAFLTGYSFLLAGLLIFGSCSRPVSNTTGWDYNNPDYGGFEYVDYPGQETGPGLILIEGGTIAVGQTEQDVVYEWDNIPRRITVSSFYMDENEIRNVDYREYLYWLSRIFLDYPEVYKKALPDTLVWRSKLGWNEPYVELYLRHPAYQEYPVVGVNWLQACDYSAWRTDRVNEWILILEGFLDPDPNQQGEENFNTDAYLASQYEGAVRGPGMEDLDPNKDFRKVRMEDGIFLPRYRLPTEGEWEFAALALIENTIEERVYERKLFPWNGRSSYIRNPEHRVMGQIMGNHVRGRGDYMGTAGALNDKADITAPVKSYWPNDYGLYCMAGNVSEWVMDVYRPLSYEIMDEFRPFRGNIFKTQVRDEEGAIAEKDSLGRITFREVTYEESYDRMNYNYANNINNWDGDFQSSIYYNQDDKAATHTTNDGMYAYGRWTGQGIQKSERGVGATSLITDYARVYKGGSWKDRTYWIIAGQRRYLEQHQSKDDLGFRCAMARVGSPVGNNY